jgi:hypothetical protein
MTAVGFYATDAGRVNGKSGGHFASPSATKIGQAFLPALI